MKDNWLIWIAAIVAVQTIVITALINYSPVECRTVGDVTNCSYGVKDYED